ncbi:hypothetical protein F5148DRAFT_635474 [Russula earlei]|uniref:Uncharacterized protein n=1 Tax=Russula earlei TaxID=71964 RepID=A0ACC0UEA6_9AGAM|nr:hypothetical protein F5148DRAFT_635474 [Russula earlei]
MRAVSVLSVFFFFLACDETQRGDHDHEGDARHRCARPGLQLASRTRYNVRRCSLKFIVRFTQKVKSALPEPPVTAGPGKGQVRAPRRGGGGGLRASNDSSHEPESQLGCVEC